MITQIAKAGLKVGLVFAAEVVYRILISVRKYRVPRSLVTSYFSLAITFDAILFCLLLALPTEVVDFSCNITCLRMLRFGSALKQLRQSAQPELILTRKMPVVLVVIELFCYLIALVLLVRISAFRNHKDLKPLSRKYASQFLPAGDSYELIRSISCRDDPFIEVLDGEELFLFDHICPWTGRNICAQKMLLFLKFLLALTLGSVISFGKGIFELFYEIQFVSRVFPGVNKFLICIATISSLTHRQILLFAYIVASFLILLVTVIQLIYQVGFKLRHILPSDLEMKIDRCRERILSEQLFYVRTKDGVFLEFLQPTFKPDQQDQQIHWEKSISSNGKKLTMEYVDRLISDLLQQRCNRLEKWRYLEAIK